MFIKILTDRDKYHSDVLELRNEWLGDLLLYVGIDIHEMSSLPKDAAIEFLIENDIEIIEYLGLKALEVRLEGELIGEWGGPELNLIEEDGTIYFEANIEYWSIMEEEIDV
tara:strand:- start:5339 stop:5671 length:333 start_codon:yes stop_codon:yes gene_type:complete